jgi:hypothetical protein
VAIDIPITTVSDLKYIMIVPFEGQWSAVIRERNDDVGHSVGPYVNLGDLLTVLFTGGEDNGEPEPFGDVY